MANKSVASEDVLSENAQPFIYVFNYKEGGFLLLSAEYGEIPILAYSDQNNFDIKKPINAGLNNWLGTVRDQIYFMRKDSLPVHDAALNQWKNYSSHSYKFEIPTQTYSTLPVSSPKLELRDRYKDDTNQSCYLTPWSVYKVDKLLQTEWGQGCGYNNVCPVFSASSYCGRAPTGCVATAMAQIVRYHQKPSWMNYSLMPNTLSCYPWNPNPCANVSSDLAVLMSQSGTRTDMNYGESGSSTQTAKIINALVGWGYANSMTFSSTLSDFRYTGVESDIDAHQPVVFRGCSTSTPTNYFGFYTSYRYSDCHAWVCDGYDIQTHPCYSSLQSYHMNWGWDGESNGFYAYPAPRTQPQWVFQYVTAVLRGIHP